MPDVSKALAVAMQYGSIDGDHHKAWVIDQMVRALTDCPVVTKQALDCNRKPYSYKALGESEAYMEWVEAACDGDEGPNTYTWTIGTPP